MRSNPLYGFLLRAALWLPPCFAVWFLAAEFLTWPANWLAGEILHHLFPGFVNATDIGKGMLNVSTTLLPPGETVVARNQWIGMDFEVNSLIPGYGLPLFVALSLATAGARGIGKILLGALLLLPPQVWGICFVFLQNVAITGGPYIAAQVGFSGLQREAVALGYQFGSLIFPSLAPVVIWLAMNRKFLGAIMLEGLLNREARQFR
ncbi:MAG: hypothetical protein KGZ83_15760 [Sulfuricella sp.]|nr:hypothetical protein [Sulfuricella sp.]